MRKMLVMLLTLAAAPCTQPGRLNAADKNGDAGAPAGQPAAPADETTLKGKVAERIDAAPYSYLKLSTNSGEVWAAVPQTEADKGSEVTVVNAFPMKDFESKTLKRKFDVVYFGTVSGGEPSAPPAAGAMPPGHPPVSGGAPQGPGPGAPNEVKDVKVAKASGPDARTVAEIHAQHTALKEKPVAVQGKVVKFNAGIMGKNWIHLRDGSGSAEKGDNDITVTTQEQATVGDVVTAKGTVRLDKDFGAGYHYAVIIEDAKVSK
jgi:hypothetical protein